MNAKIFSFVKVTEHSMIASCRIARFVKETLRIPLCWDTSIANSHLDVLFIVNGAYAFAGSDLLAALGSAILNANRVVWIQNDYTIIPPKVEGSAKSPFRKAFVTRHKEGKLPTDYWTTVTSMTRPGPSKPPRHRFGWVIGPNSRYINWNCLTFDWDIGILDMHDRAFSDVMVYYGSYREDRAKYFRRYFDNTEVSTLISSPSGKFVEHKHDYHVVLVSKWDELSSMLVHFGLGLYIEDRLSHTNFHSPANRFYEMLSCGVPMVFQPECEVMLKKAGYDVTPWIVRKASDIAPFMERRAELVEDQRAAFWQLALESREKLEDELLNAVEQLQ